MADQLQCPVDAGRGGEIGGPEPGRDDHHRARRSDAEPPRELRQVIERRQHARRVADLGTPAVGGVVAVDGAGNVAELEGLAAALGRTADVDDDEIG